MKRPLIYCLLFLAPLLVPSSSQAQVPGLDIFLGLPKRVIKAIDLQIQRFQNKTIGLQNAEQEILNALHKLKLDEITEWATKQKELYQTFYDELWKVKNVISYYKRGKDIIQMQISLVSEYKRAYALFKQDDHFTPEEIQFMGDVYDGILSESVRNLEQLQLVLSSFSVQMDDAKRLEIMENAASKIEENATDLKRFNNSNVIISLQRTKSAAEINTIRKLYGIN